MIRTVPETISDPIDLYIRTYYSLLRSSGPVRVRSLEESYLGTDASLHPGAGDASMDVSAFTYAVARLPACILGVDTVLLGQSDEVFRRRAGIALSSWQSVTAVARRRKMFYDGDRRLACYISSVSDIDDLIPILTALQIEWNKLHQRLQTTGAGHRLRAAGEVVHLPDAELDAVRLELGLSDDEFDRLRHAWNREFGAFLGAVVRHPLDLQINLLAGSVADYRQASQAWWSSVAARSGVEDLRDRPVYFVSSNPHALPNLLSGFAAEQREQLLACLDESDPEDLRIEWRLAEASGDRAVQANLLYYLLRTCRHRVGLGARRAVEEVRGIHRIEDPHYLDVGAQVVELRRLDPTRFDDRVRLPGLEALARSDALIVNVDYPLGMAAYALFSQVSSAVPAVAGVYIMGKAATLNGRVGDVMIPNVVFDEHSSNTFLFKNCFTAAHVAPWLRFGTVFDNQKSVTVRGTLLQNREFMNVFYREGYTDIEMEAGPYLSAVYEDIYPKRYPVNEIVNLFINTPYDVGILHYASDTPYSRRQSLLSKSMSWFGVDATYATSVAIVRRILERELARLG